jgi:uncharacterized membrane protein YphA (DoxX/SURF4 family)
MYRKLFHSEPAGPTQTNFAGFILRLALALIFLYHGFSKIQQDGGARWVDAEYGKQGTATEMERQAVRPPREIQEGKDGPVTDVGPQGNKDVFVPMPTFMSYSIAQLAVAWGEFLGGLALLGGLLTRLAAVGEIAIQIGAVICVTYPRGFSLKEGTGYELNLVLIGTCLSLAILGPGKWSLDWLYSEQHRRAQRAAAAAGQMPAGGPQEPSAQSAEPVAPGSTS